MLRITMRTTLMGAFVICCQLGLSNSSPVSAQDAIVDAPEYLPALPEGYLPDSTYAGEFEYGQGAIEEVPYDGTGYQDLFYNYYTSNGSPPAAMYPAPRPTPALVGHTYYTYQPWLPHEFLYRHHRVYWTYYGHFHGGCNGQYQGCPSINKTTVSYGRGTIRPFFCFRMR